MKVLVTKKKKKHNHFISNMSLCQTLGNYFWVKINFSIPKFPLFPYWVRIYILFFTAHIRRMGKGTVFSLSVHTREVGTPICPTEWGIAQSFLLGGPLPSCQGSTPILPDRGVGVPTNQETEQQREHLLRGGPNASCVHAGGLSCTDAFFVLDLILTDLPNLCFS